MMGSYLGWRLGSVYGDWLPQNLGFMQENRSLPFHPTLKLSGGEGVKRICTNLWSPIHWSDMLYGKNVT
jgi:hypothetical protein